MFGRFPLMGVGVFTVVCFACGGTVQRGGAGGGEAGEASGGSGQSGGGGSGGGGTSGGTTPVGGTSPLGGTAGGDAGPDVIIDPGCPDAEPPPPSFECDAFATTNECGDGYGCYPYVDHPAGSGCDFQLFGTVCAPAGIGRQGDLCGGETGDWCAGGHTCVIGLQPGKRCAKICELGAPNACPEGLLCGPLDVEGFGVCG